MADQNVFGTPITDETLRKMPRFHDKQITKMDRATVAMEMRTDGAKDVKVLEYVENLKKKYEKNGIFTLSTIYNGTGDVITIDISHDWYGHLVESPYPLTIANGQWGGFLHVNNSGDNRSRAAVVYRGRNNKGDVCDWMLAWCTTPTANQVYTEIREQGHFHHDPNDHEWSLIDEFLAVGGAAHSDNWNGCSSLVSTSGGTAAIFEGIMTLA